jgi:signal transduction histidine kinase
VGARARALLIAGGTAIVVMLLLALRALDVIELPLRDAALRLLPRRAATATVVVAIDEASLEKIGQWPWPRATVAQLVERAAGAGARGIVVDFVFVEPADGDARLAQVLRRTPSILVAALDNGAWRLPPPTLRDAATLAHGNFELDHDGIVRRLAATKQSRDRALPAVCYDAAALLRPTAVPVGHVFAPAFRSAPKSVPVVSAAELLAGQARAPVLHGKIVFIGPTATALGDRVLTPVSGPEPGVTVHAAATESLLRGEEIRELPPWLGGVLVAIVGSAAALSKRRQGRRTPEAIVLALLVAGGGLLLLAKTGIAIPFASLLLTIVIATAATALLQSRKAATESATRLVRFREREAESKRVLAHELKTPLASMRGLTQLLTSFDLSDAERRRVTALLESEAGKLQSMVQALLDLERLSLREFGESTQVVDLAALVAARVDFLRASTDRELRIAPATPALVRADPILIERVVDNLVGNALKYTASSVSVAVRHHGGVATLEVEDRGGGISDADRERIFQRFFRGATAAGTQGLGLGLSLVAEVARWHEGSVAVEAAPAGGSLFRVTFPLASAYAKAGAM